MENILTALTGDIKMKTFNWKKIIKNGLPIPGFYLFKNKDTMEVKRAEVKEDIYGNRYWISCTENFNKATHYCDMPLSKV